LQIRNCSLSVVNRSRWW